MRLRSLVLGLVLVLVLTTLVGCAQARPARRDVVIGMVGEPTSVFADDPNARLIAAAVTEDLVRRDAHDDFVARLATRVPTLENGGLTVLTDDPASPDGRLVATFELRPDLVWQDGAPLTSGDVRFAWETDRAAPLGSETRWIADRVERVDVITDRVARLTYRANERWDGYAIAARVLPEHLLANASPARLAQYAREPVHAGPFAVAAWLPGIGITLSAFKSYALGAPALGRLEIRFFPGRTALLDALRRGEVDVVPSPGLEADLAGTLDRFADGTTLQTFYKQSESVEVLRYGPRFADPALREAVELTIDRRKLNEVLFEGRAVVPRSYLVAPGWAAGDAGAAPDADTERARSLLLAAGFTRGPFGILEHGGDRFTVSILVPAGSTPRSDAARLVAGDLAAIGIAADVREQPPEAAAVALAAGTFDLAIVPEDVSDPQRATDRYRGAAGPWFEALAAAAAAAGDRAEKRLLYAELERVWDDARPALPLYQRLQVDVAPRALAAIDPPSGGVPLTWNVREWRFTTP
ncbi:MAG: peptide/nickel transport system substrate-binding protein [Chloroflexota bacterium]|nr:peptide/nickel transport system substrate-binding protein [Chloroflexota bacterium]